MSAARDAGVVHEDVDRPERRLGALEELRHRTLVPYVARRRPGTPAARLNRRFELASRRLALAVRHANRSPGLGERFRNRSADPARPAGDYGNAPCEAQTIAPCGHATPQDSRAIASSSQAAGLP